MLASGSITPDQYRVIFESQVVPRTTIGWFYNLNPALAVKIDQAILSFQPTTEPSGSSDSESSDSTAMHFVPVDYKNDFQLVRLIDDRFEPRLDAKAKETAAVPATQPVAQP